MDKSELLTRGVSKVIPSKLAEEKLKAGKPIRVYLGIDPTGNKLHLGHSVPLRKLAAFADAGHEVIFLVGSFTAMVGDPTGRDTLREPLTMEEVKKNFETYKEQAGKILNFSKIQIKFNHEWLEKLTLKELVQLESHFTVQQMLERDMFEKRLRDGKPVSKHEFLYPTMVAYDSVMLDVDCEIGGTDQEFNMLCGRTLQKALGKREKFVLTLKLIEGTDGRKMSKTYDNCIYLEDSATEMYGKTMRLKDDLITVYMECCTDIKLKEITEVEKQMKKGANPKDFKMRLAREIVTLYHGAYAAEEAEKQFQNVFADKGTPDDMKEVKLKKGSLLIDLLIAEGLIPTKSEARRLIEQKGITVNDAPVTDLNAKAEQGIIKVGKRKFLKIS